jgi:hypothetical protein
MTSIENTNNNHPFPFHSLTNNDFKTQNDDCNHLKFNPFQTNSNIALSGNNDDLDSLFDINNIDCKYLLPMEFN